MDKPKHLESREDIQVERLLFFSDGVFAISITLMVIEMKVPEGLLSDKALLKDLSHMLLKFLGFLISFAVVGQYWIVHHRIFGYVKKYTNNLIWINLLFLLAVVILPFSSGLLGEYSSDMDMKVPYLIYVGGICFVGAMNILLWHYVSKPKLNLLTHHISKSRIRLGHLRSLTIPVVFLLSLLVSFFHPLTSRFIPILIPFILHFGMKPLERRANKEEVVVDKSE